MGLEHGFNQAFDPHCNTLSGCPTKPLFSSLMRNCSTIFCGDNIMELNLKRSSMLSLNRSQNMQRKHIFSEPQ